MATNFLQLNGGENNTIFWDVLKKRNSLTQKVNALTLNCGNRIKFEHILKNIGKYIFLI
jgi:hypothetical protein